MFLSLPTTTSNRYNDIIDLYVNKQVTVSHYYACPTTNWLFEGSTIDLMGSRVGKIAMVRINDYIDIFMVDYNCNLLRYSANPDTKWQYVGGSILGNVNPSVPVVAVRFPSKIQVACVNKNNELMNLDAGEHTGWAYNSWPVRTGQNGPILGLSCVGYMDFVMDLYFIEGGTLMHGFSMQSNGWAYNFGEIAKGAFLPVTACSRFQDNLNVFCVSKQGLIHHYFASDKTQWSYHFKACINIDLPPFTFFSSLSVIQTSMCIDVFYNTQRRIHRVHCDQNLRWIKPVQIEATDVIGGVSACRCQWNISVFYVGQGNKAKQAYLSSDSGWSRFDVSNVDFTLDKPILHWQQIQGQCQFIGSGHFGHAHKHNGLNLIVKRLKDPSQVHSIINEINILDQVSKIYPNMCQYQVFEKYRLVGFTVRFFKGRSWKAVLEQQDSVFRHNSVSRVKLVFKLAEEAVKLQDIKVAHGDFSLGNILVEVLSKNSQQPKFEVKMIDYGLSCMFGTSSAWLGWELLSPPECGNKPYNTVGLNPYQLGRVCIQILLGQLFSNYSNISISPQPELQKLQKEYSSKYPSELIQMMRRLVSPNVQTRIDCLYYMLTRKGQVCGRTFEKTGVIWRPPSRSQFVSLNQAPVLTDNVDIDQFSQWRKRPELLQEESDPLMEIFHGTVANQLTNIPYVGSVLGAIYTFLSSSKSSSIDLFKKILSTELEKQFIKDRTHHLQGIRQLMKYLEQCLEDYEKHKKKYKDQVKDQSHTQILASIWNDIMSHVITAMPFFTDEKYAQAVFPSYVLLANFHLTLLIYGLRKRQRWNLLGVSTKKIVEEARKYRHYVAEIVPRIEEHWQKEMEQTIGEKMAKNPIRPYYQMGYAVSPNYNYQFQIQSQKQQFTAQVQPIFTRQRKLLNSLSKVYGSWREVQRYYAKKL